MDYVTLIVVPEACAPVRRRRLPRALVRFGPAALLGFCLASAGLGADWVRLRLAAIEVAGLRATAAADRAALAGLAVELRSLETRLGRVSDFERKLRIVADLPDTTPVSGALLEQDLAPASPLHNPGSGVAPERGGQGGEAEPLATPAPAPPVSSGAAVGTPPPRAPRPEGLDGAALERVQGRAERLSARALQLDRSLEALFAALGRRRERLAALPSIAPVLGWVTSRFGWRRSPFSGRQQFHAGLDIAARPGAEFVATAGGRVLFAGVRGALGRTVVLDHGHDLVTTYGHAAALDVRAGQVVARGQRLGAVGSSGRSTGPHVHYAVTFRGRAVDPADYLLD